MFSIHTTPRRNLKTKVSLLKHSKCFPSTLHRGEISKQRFHCENRANVFRSPYTAEKFQNKGFTLKTKQMFSVHTTPEKFVNKGFLLKTKQMFFVHTTQETFEKKTRFLSENTANVHTANVHTTPSSLHRRNLKTKASL